MPDINWAPTSSFQQWVLAPTADPDVGLQVQLPCINQDYLPLILGCLDQLRNPATYDPGLADADRDLAIKRAELLRCMMAGAIGSPCGGRVPAIGPGGPQQACNIAGYLANVVIRQAMDAAIQHVQFNLGILNFAVFMMRFLPPGFVLTTAFVTGLDVLYQRVATGLLTDYQDAVADPTLMGKIACAIYTATSTDGQVTCANFANVLAAVDGVGYAHADVKAAIHDYLAALGCTGVMQLQTVGVLADYDCSGCGGTGGATGPSFLNPLVQAGKTLLTILAGASDATQLLTFAKPFTAPPLLLTDGDNEDLIYSVHAISDTQAMLTITSAVPVTADTPANVSWEARIPVSQ